jgi:ribosomal protein L11 methyltransferase
MEYTELVCIVKDTPELNDILIARLSMLGFEMFEEIDNGIKAYVPTKEFPADYAAELADLNEKNNISYSVNIIPSQNWNETWERNFEPVVIADSIYIHADFHPRRPEFTHSIRIQPKMAFGTGHHATTSLVMEEMLQTDLKNKKVLDMGCGTGILAILASQLYASELTGIDNDEVATENARENCQLNGVHSINIVHGNAAAINDTYDIILANINRNILVEDVNVYTKHLSPGGKIIMSGFYVEDIPIIERTALSNGLQLINSTEKNNWSCLVFKSAE